ncbi:MAG: TIGR03936 family radical SAM-associated protein [Clostridiales bacterium]|jgi:radical SAM-linked protein|nr:TIGR03936 family radical SAM-associated protein [Clostridiales bacterium]
MVTIKYKKTAAAVYISHIDIFRAVYRGIRRANLDVAYSKGYNAHAELFLSPPLPLFAYSDCEYFTADTKENADEFFKRYSAAAHNLLPPVSRFYTAKNPNLAGKIFSADYSLEIPGATAAHIKKLLEKDEIVFTNRNGKEKNIRPYIYRAEIIPYAPGIENDGSQSVNAENNAIKNAGLKNENQNENSQKPNGKNDENAGLKNAFGGTIIRINIDSTNLRAETAAAEIESLSGQKCRKITKTAQYVKIDGKIIEADEYLTELSKLNF